MLLYVRKSPSKHTSGTKNGLDTQLGYEGKIKYTSFSYREAIGRSIYLMIFRSPDLSFLVGNLARSCENPSNKHGSSLKRLIRYVNRTVKCLFVMTVPFKFKWMILVLRTGLEIFITEIQQLGTC